MNEAGPQVTLEPREGTVPFPTGLVDYLLIASTVGILVAIAFALRRAGQVGWSLRDIAQGLAACSLVVLALVRHRFPARIKASFLIGVFIVGALPGLVTLGMLGGTVVLFPATAAMVATFYSQRLAWLYVFFTAAVVALVGSAFCLGLLGSDILPEEYLQSGRNWSVYVACIALSCMVSSVTVIRYRQAMDKLLGQVAEQRDKLSSRNAELVRAMEQVKRLSGMLPICSACKRIRDDKGYWRQIESYVREHSEAEFTHGICPDCVRVLYPDDCEPFPAEGTENTPLPV